VIKIFTCIVPVLLIPLLIGNESVLIQLAQCRFPGLAISSAKILIYVSNEMYGSNFTKMLIAV